MTTLTDIATLQAQTWSSGVAPDTVWLRQNHCAGDGGGAFMFDAADTTSADDNAMIVVTASGRRYKRSWTQLLATFWARNDNTDCTTQIANMVTWIGAQTYAVTCFFPRGVYRWSSSPNFAIANAKFIPLGEVRLRSTGTGNAVILDGGAGVYDVTFGTAASRFIIEAPSNAGHGVYCNYTHHSTIGVIIRGCGTDRAAVYARTVCTDYYVIATVNHEGWYNGGSGIAKPAIGVMLEGASSYNVFYDLKAEGTLIGVLIDDAGGNLFLGGTAEACGEYGVVTTVNAAGNRFIGMDFEVNAIGDAYIEGFGNVIQECDSGYDSGSPALVLAAGARGCVIDGGLHVGITLVSGAMDNVIRGVVYDRFDAGAVINDNGSSTRIEHVASGSSALSEDPAQRRIRLYDDFLGNARDTRLWRESAGSAGGGTSIATGIPGGYLSLGTGINAAGTMATNGVQIDSGALEWRPASGELILEVSFFLGDNSSEAFFIGFTDQHATLEMPFTMGASNVLTSNASNAVGFLYDTAATTDHWWGVGVRADVDATPVDLGAPKTAGERERIRLVVQSNGSARFYRDGVLAGIAANAVAPGTFLTYFLGGFGRTSAGRAMHVDYVSATQGRS